MKPSWKNLVPEEQTVGCIFILGSNVCDVNKTSGNIPVKSCSGKNGEEIRLKRKLRLLNYVENCGFHLTNEVFKAEQVMH